MKTGSPLSDDVLQDRLETLAQHWESEDWKLLKREAEALLAEVPNQPDAIRGWAMAEWELGEPEAALTRLDEGLKANPDDLDLTFSYAEALMTLAGEGDGRLDQAIKLAHKGSKAAKKHDDAELLIDFLLLRGIAQLEAGFSAEALTSFDEVLALDADHREAKLEKAFALFELSRFTDATKHLEAMREEGEDDGQLFYLLGLLAERAGNDVDAKAHLARATKDAPDRFPPAVELGDEHFDSVVEDALAKLPEDVRHHLENVTVAVEPFPPREELIAADPPLSPTILGLFRGTPIGERSVTRAEDHQPAAIVLYQRNLERFAKNREDLVEQIRITVLHEFGHLLGLDEDDLADRGLD